MERRRCDVLVIGAGTAGMKAYKAARRRGADVLMVEKGPGGSTCTRVGCMPSKLLIAAGRRAYEARRALPGIDNGPVAIDGPAVLAWMRRERDRFVQSVLDEYHAIPAERRLHGEARVTGPTTVVVGNTTVEATAIVVATGAHPTVPDGLDLPASLIHTHETIFEIETLPAAMAVLGAGPLGLELAQAFARLGVAVTVLDEGRSIGGLKDPASTDRARAALAREVDLHLGVQATARSNNGRALVSWQGDEKGETEVDLILVAVGRPPTLEGLDLTAAGAPLDDHGTPTFDETTRRSGDSAIFVAGDAAGSWRPVLHEAARGGTIAGTVAAGGPPSRPIPSLAIAFTEPNLVEVGTGFADLPPGARIGHADMKDNGRASIDGEPGGIVRLYGDADGQLIGASIVALGGEHLGHLVALGIDRGISVADFADQPWYHPTVEEGLQQAARDLAGIEA
ncbi:dihydrolipoamide dehydrogenase [Sphingomonas rubra]|uniref:Dihydrolipoamide dehydrogenase n=2 Tax=Sphingomonas rubra TaxID=634430 RepID=A0A1I5SY03_9SPHN|nr:dihydrolipoamide dehydrogenase [Sphingomonas rubra]